MINRKNFILFAILASLMIFISGCSSTPEPEPEVVESVSQSVAEVIEDEEALAQAAALAADTARLMAELTAAKEAANVAGCESLFPEEFAKISAEYDALLKAQQENPAGDYRSQIENLRDSYLAMAKLSQAMQIRERLVTAGLEDSDPENFQKGENAVAQAQSLYESGASGAQLLEQANIAHEAYFTILAANFLTLCQSQREAALAAKEKADSIKSAMAAKEAYAAAELALSGADAAYASHNYEEAYDGFVAATNAFNNVYDDVFVRRAIAEEAIRRAKEKVDTSAAIAAEADEIAPLQDEETSAEEGNESVQEVE